jgi:protein Mpv17
LATTVEEATNNFVDVPQAMAGFWEDNKLNIEKVFNALLLVSSFGYALYTILSVDAGMTRGWTQSEIAMRVPLDNWHSYESALAESPVATKTAINVIIYLLGDWLSQTVFQGKNVLDFDAKRTLRNGFIGLCFGPLVHQYYEWSDSILPVEAGLMNRLKKIFMDQTLYLTVKCSIYIAAVGLLSGEKPKDVANNVKERILPICFTAWKFWPLVHCITYGAIPARHRILWVNCVDLVWSAILASKATSAPEEQEEAVVEDHLESIVHHIEEHVPELEVEREHDPHVMEHFLHRDDVSLETAPELVPVLATTGSNTSEAPLEETLP